MSTPPVLQSIQQLDSYLDQQVELHGTARRAKAGNLLKLDTDETIWCRLKEQDWGPHAGQRVRVIGTVIRQKTPLESFPVAQQNSAGEWSQGVTAPDSLRMSGLAAELLGSPAAPSFSPSSSDFVLQVQDCFRQN